MLPKTAADQPPAQAAPRPVAKAWCLGAALVAVGFAVALAAGAPPAGDRVAGAVGAAGAALVAGAAALVQPRLLRHAAVARAPGAQVQLALGVAFVAKLLGLLLGTVLLLAAGVKFSGVAAFAISFAAASLVLQVCIAAVSHRGSARATTDLARTDPLR